MKNDYKRIVVKVGTTTLTHDNGKLNLKKIDQLALILSDIKNSGKDVILVTSGAIAAGLTKLGMTTKPDCVKSKQAVASVGQCDLMFIYDKFFSEYGQTVSQLLITKSVLNDPTLKANVLNTFEQLLEYGVIPIVNENDSIAIEEIVFGDNDTLSAVTSCLVNADLLILLSDIDGLYNENPKNNEHAKLINLVSSIDENILAMASDSCSKFGTGGMITKLSAAQIVMEKGIDMVICNGSNVKSIYDILDGMPVGTLFKGAQENA